MTDFRIRASLERMSYDYNDYLIKDAATEQEALEFISDLQCRSQSGESHTGIGEVRVINLMLYPDGTYVPVPPGAPTGIYVLEPEGGDEVMKFELIDERGNVVREMGTVTPTDTHVTLPPKEFVQEIPSAEEGFRIRAFRERITSAENDYLVTGVSTIEEPLVNWQQSRCEST